MFATVRKIILSVFFLGVIGFVLLRIFSAHDQVQPNSAIQINEYVMSAEEFSELFKDLELADNSKEAKEAFLNNLINRKLILQEAQKLSLDTEADFLKSIERFWEQTLLKIVLDQKVKQIRSRITISDGEVNTLYTQWLKENPGSLRDPQDVKTMLREKIIRDRQTAELDAWIETLRRTARISVDRKKIGIDQ